MGALLPVLSAVVGGGLRDRRDIGCACALVGHVAAAGRAPAGLAVDGSDLCERLPGRAARASGSRARPAHPHRARRRRDGARVSDLFLFPDLCAAPRTNRPVSYTHLTLPTNREV